MAAMLALKLLPHALSRFVVCGALPPTVLLRTLDGLERKPLGESNLARDRFFFALLLLILYGAFLILTPFLTAITWAAILAILFYPVYAGLLELMRGRARSQR